jgi:hypothetical protein
MHATALAVCSARSDAAKGVDQDGGFVGEFKFGCHLRE